MSEAKALETVESVSKSEFTVYNELLAVVRVYSVEVHGEKAGELAEEFVNKQRKEYGKVLIIT